MLSKKPMGTRDRKRLIRRSAHGSEGLTSGPRVTVQAHTVRMNPLLAETKARIEGSVPASLKERYLKLLVGGMTVLWSEQTHAHLQAFVAQSITVPEEVPDKVAQWMLRVNRTETQAETSPDVPWYLALTWAMLYLTCDVLEYVEQKTRFPVDRQVLDRTTALVKHELAWRYGTPNETA